MNKYAYLLIFNLLCLFSYAQTDWEKDINFLKSELPTKHKNLFFLKPEQYYNNSLENIKSHSNSLKDEEIILKLQQLIASMGDSHTRINWFGILNKELILPLNFYWFSDGIYIIKASEDYEELIGAKLLAINSYKTEVIIDSLSTLLTIDNDAIIKSQTPQFISFTQLLNFFGFANNNKYVLSLQKDGKIIDTEVTPSVIDIKFKGIEKDKLPYCWQNTKSAFRLNYFEKDKILYVQYNICTSVSINNDNGTSDTIHFGEFKKQIFRLLEEKDVDKLIFDMRFNGGGNSFFATKFVNELKHNPINKKGKLFVVIGRKTFSSAILNTLDFKKKTNAIIVGENTGGKPNHYGEVKNFILPNSGVRVFYSSKYFHNSKDNSNTIKPDFTIELSYSDFFNGIDPVYEWISSY